MNIIEAARLVEKGKNVHRISDPYRIYTDSRCRGERGLRLFSLLNTDGSISPVPLSLDELSADDWEVVEE